MNPPASGTGHGFVDFHIGQVIGSPALHLLAGSWASVNEVKHWQIPHKDHARLGQQTVTRPRTLALISINEPARRSAAKLLSKDEAWRGFSQKICERALRSRSQAIFAPTPRALSQI